MTCLTREQIVAACDLKMEKVFVPEWADDDPEAYVMVKSWTGAERDAFEKSVTLLNVDDPTLSKIDIENYRSKVCLFSICDDQGRLLFGINDLQLLEGKSAKALTRVFTKAQELNGLDAKSMKDVTKNS